MEKKYNYLLLIEDNKALSFLNKVTLTKLDIAKEVIIAENGKEALKVITQHGIPELIFLDINMPIMNGWEFLDAYKKIDTSMDKSVITLSTGFSLNTQEQELATKKYNITNFCNKTLNKSVILDLINNSFCKPKQIEYIYN